MSNKPESKNIDDLIGSLSDELTPVKKASHPLLYSIPWLLIATIFAVITVKYTGIRYDLTDKLHDPIFLFDVLNVALIGVFASIASSYLMVPDMRGKRWLIPVTITFAAVFLVWNIVKTITQGLHIEEFGFDHCMSDGLFMAFMPMIAFMFFMRSGSTTRPITMGVMNLLAGASIAYIGLRMTCPMDSVGHSTISHLFPYLVVGALIGTFARRLYKW